MKGMYTLSEYICILNGYFDNGMILLLIYMVQSLRYNVCAPSRDVPAF